LVNGGENRSVADAGDSMGIDWMNKNELNEALSPICRQFIGKQLIAQLLAPKRIKSKSRGHA